MCPLDCERRGRIAHLLCISRFLRMSHLTSSPSSKWWCVFYSLCVPQFVGRFKWNLVRFDSYDNLTLHKHSRTKRAKTIFHDMIVDIRFATSLSTNWCRGFWRVHWPSNPGPGWFETPARTQDLETPAKAQDCRCEPGVTDTSVGEDARHEAYGMAPQTLHKPMIGPKSGATDADPSMTVLARDCKML